VTSTEAAVDGDPVGVAPAAEQNRSSMGAFKHRDFALFWWTALISNSGSWMQTVAVPKVIYDLTGSSTWLGIAALASLGPSLILTAFAGVLADRVSRRLILIVTQLVQMAVAIGLFALYLADAMTPLRIIWLLVVSGIAAGFQTSAWQSFVPTLVPRERLMDAVRLNSVQFTAARALGPGFGALALTLFGTGTAFLLNALTYVLVVAALLVVNPRQVIGKAKNEPVFKVLAEGFRFVASRQVFRRIVLTMFLISLLGQTLMQLAAGIAADLYNKPTADNAILVAAMGVGSVPMSIYIIGWAGRVQRSRMVLFSIVVYFIGVSMIPLSSNFTVGVIAFGLLGVAHMPLASTMNTYLQAYVADEIRGRVLSIYLLAVMAGMPAGALIFGRLADVIGMRQAMAIDALAFAGLLVLVVVGFNRFTAIDRDEPVPLGAT
jgi:MFS family permease